MGTHNALLKLGTRSYLEVIAIDPDGAAPNRPRWFSLDEPEMQAQLAESPRLITWAVRCESLANACARVPDLGEILSMNRDDLHWKIAVPENGTLPWGGVLPTHDQRRAGRAFASAVRDCRKLEQPLERLVCPREIPNARRRVHSMPGNAVAGRAHAQFRHQRQVLAPAVGAIAGAQMTWLATTASWATSGSG